MSNDNLRINPQLRGLSSNQQMDAFVQNIIKSTCNPVFDENNKLAQDCKELRCMLNQAYLAQGQLDRLDKVPKKNYDAAKNTFGTMGLVVPTARRLASMPDSLEVGDTTRATGMAALAVANLPSDWRELKGGLHNIYTGIDKTKGYQHNVSFFKGTFLHGLYEKYGFLQKLDKTLFETNTGLKVCEKMGIQFDDKDLSKAFGKSADSVYGYKAEGSFIKKVIGRSLLRLNVLGVVVSSAFEIPAIFKAAKTKGSFMDKVKAVSKQTLKSAGYIALATAGITLGGAALPVALAAAGITSFGFAGSLLGMGIGSYLALGASRELNKKIDQSFT